MLALHEAEELAKLGCDMNSKVADVFERLPGRMKKPPANAAEIFSTVATVVEEEFQADTLAEMMELMLVGQFEKVLTQAGGKATWVAWIEMIFGMKFKTGSSVPSSAQLLAPASGTNIIGHKPTFDVQPIGAMMRDNGTLAEEILPEYIYEAVAECEDVTCQPITPNDLTAVLNAYQHYMIVTHKQPHGDKVLRQHHAKQLKARLPHLPDHGKTAGATRRFDQILNERKRNFSRKKSLQVSPCPFEPTLSCRQVLVPSRHGASLRRPVADPPLPKPRRARARLAWLSRLTATRTVLHVCNRIALSVASPSQSRRPRIWLLFSRAPASFRA